MSEYKQHKGFNEKIKQFKLCLKLTMKNMFDLYCEVEARLCNSLGSKSPSFSHNTFTLPELLNIQTRNWEPYSLIWVSLGESSTSSVGAANVKLLAL